MRRLHHDELVSACVHSKPVVDGFLTNPGIRGQEKRRGREGLMETGERERERVMIDEVRRMTSPSSLFASYQKKKTEERKSMVGSKSVLG